MLTQLKRDAGRDFESQTAFRLQPFKENRTPWTQILQKFPGATLYHSERWTRLLIGAYGLPLQIATLLENDEIVAAGLFARSPFSSRLVALSFSDACPPLSHDPGAAQRLLGSLAESAPPRVIYEVRGIRAGAPWQTIDCFVNWQMNLERPLAQIESGLAMNFRRNLKHAARQSIEMKCGSSVDLLRRFYAMQLESRRRLGLPPQPWHFFTLAREIFSPGDFEVWIAREKGRDVASAVFIRDGDVVHYKWGARCTNDHSRANHLLFWSAIRQFASNARILDLGRADIRNRGLMRFKKELGSTQVPLPCSFYPRTPRQVSAEVLTGTRKKLSALWSRLPIAVTKVLGGMIYRYLG